jgi:ribonuclease HI
MNKYPSAVKIYTDGCARGNPGPAAAAFVVENAEGKVIDEAGRGLGVATNNEAEYHALILALERAAAMGARTVVVHTDSELMERQLNGVYRIRNSRLARLARRVEDLRLAFDAVRIAHVQRERNRRADRLANRALDREKKKLEDP